MQSFGVFFNDNKPLAITLILLAGIVAVAILIFLYRLLFGRRLHMAGNSRARQPRLGVVDAFDLDRQRQLVLVRRDNVEHLIMIGGPNDVVIESAFVRMQPNVVLPIGRDKDAGGAPSLPMASIPAAIGGLSPEPFAAPVASTPPVAPMVAANGRDRAIPPLDLGEPLQGVGPETLEAIAAPAPMAAPSMAAPPMAPVPMAPVPMASAPVAPAPIAAPTTAPPPVPIEGAEPAPEPGPEAPLPVAPEAETQRPVQPPSRFASTLQPRPPGTAPLTPRPSLSPRPAGTLPPRPMTTGPRPMGAPLSRGTSAASLRRDPPAPPVPATPVGPVEAESVEAKPDARDEAPPTAPPLQGDTLQRMPATPTGVRPGGTSSDRPPVGALPTTLDTLESLEEEMARLLGRPPAGPGKP